MPIAQGLTVSADGEGSGVTSLLTTSAASFSKAAGYDLDTYEKEEGDIDRAPLLWRCPSTVGMEVRLSGFPPPAFLDDMYNAYSSGANGDLAMNAVSSLIGESEAMAIRSKSLNYNYLTINDAVSSLLQVVMIGVFPLLYLGIGIWVVLKRRRAQNVPV